MSDPAPRPMTFAEKMFAKAAGKPAVAAGDIVHPDPSLVIIHDGYLRRHTRSSATSATVGSSTPTGWSR